jgi:microcystin-dependent protein
MTEPFTGQIQPFGFGFAPRNWAQCTGQILSIQQNTALFALLGTQYGGNGTTTFGLPDLQSRVPVHAGTAPGGSETFFQGEAAGEETVMISLNTMPAHGHGFMGSTANGTSTTPVDGLALATVHLPSSATPPSFYGPDTSPLQPLNMASVSTVGGNQSHANIQPYQAINWCIALSGNFPSRG